jgi:nucleoside-diphosphate-sugar epimerase
MNTVLVAGATGLVGEAAVAQFAGARWNVIAVSRRTPDPSPAGVHHLALDLTDREACASAAGALSQVTHLVYAALYEKPGLVAGWRDPEQMQTNLAMLRNLLDPLTAAAGGLRHVTLLQGAKAYGGHVGLPPPIPARERAPRVEHPNFYWLQEDELRARAPAKGFDWTIFRPQIVVGAAWGAAMNPLLPLAIYAAIRQELGLPFSYTGGARQVQQLCDPRLLGQAFEWAATTPAAANQTFNITNGEEFAWADVWPALADAFGVAPGPPEPTHLAEFLPAHADIWDRIVARDSLRPIGLMALLGESHHYADALLRPGLEVASGPPTLLSTIKLRQAGFGACYDSEETLRHWARELAARGLTPPAKNRPAETQT